MIPSPTPSEITKQIGQEVAVLYDDEEYIVLGETDVSDYPTIGGFDPRADE
jgi:hypothetical protein